MPRSLAKYFFSLCENCVCSRLASIALFSAFSLTIASCTHKPIKTELQKLSEASLEQLGGFYLPAQLPAERLTSLGLKSSVVSEVAQSVGAFAYNRNYQYDEKTAQDRFTSYCGTDTSRELNPEFCTAIEKAVGGRAVAFSSFHFGCSGVVLGENFVTAKHCLPSPGHLVEPKMRIRLGGRYQTFNLITSAHTYTLESFDLAVFEIKGMTPALRQVSAKVSTRAIEVGQPVIGVGYPILSIRKAREWQLDYPLEPRVLRVSLGRVVLPNKEAKRFCAYTNEDGVANIEAWVLYEDCERVDRSKLKYAWREEADPFFVNIDMTWGMSGSPLFNSYGELIGIGSNVLSNDPTFYNSHKLAIYVKATHVADVLR